MNWIGVVLNHFFFRELISEHEPARSSGSPLINNVWEMKATKQFLRMFENIEADAKYLSLNHTSMLNTCRAILAFKACVLRPTVSLKPDVEFHCNHSGSVTHSELSDSKFSFTSLFSRLLHGPILTHLLPNHCSEKYGSRGGQSSVAYYILYPRESQLTSTKRYHQKFSDFKKFNQLKKK